MKPHSANVLNAIVLMAMGLWGYFSTHSNTAFIPVGFGVILLLCNNGLRKENKTIAHIAIVITLLILLMYLGMMLPKGISQGGQRLMRTIPPIITGIIAMVAFIKSFKAARKARAEN